MKAATTDLPVSGVNQAREQMVVRSALWAAAGDALGWITELSHGQANVKRRSGTALVEMPVAWKRVIGGRTGPKVDLPAGTYSDDTQLRLAVSRAIRGDGNFDAEAFAKVELTVWPTYALGGGLGTKAAALSLSRRSTSWFSNFFESGSQRYINGGGNGAAMRVQPHVWVSKGTVTDLVLAVLRDALVTHGHPQGFCGAVFHALVLHSTISTGAVPTPDVWEDFIDVFLEIPEILDRDPQLAAFWQAAWEVETKTTLSEALNFAHREARADLERTVRAAPSLLTNEYHNALAALGCLSNEYRGAGFKTALAALVLAFMHRDTSIENALAQAANELESDTDTIATMTGALLGAISGYEPSWPIQDREYIQMEAKRLSDISSGHQRESFVYPDLARWVPPANQLAAIGWLDNELAIAGLGTFTPLAEEYRVGDSTWQWGQLPFGQSVLAKRKTNLRENIPSDQMPGKPTLVPSAKSKTQKTPKADQQTLRFVEPDSRQANLAAPFSEPAQPMEMLLDTLTNEAIRSEFDDVTLGRLLNQCIDTSGSIEAAIGFAAIVAKAKLARNRKRR